jgi:cellulose synthase operon protein YhjQ
MVATIGRTLSAMGERVLLADATPHGLLPYYFGAHELRPDVVRTFSPPPESKDAPVFMVNYEAERLSRDEAGQTALLEEVTRHARGTQRVLMDLNNSSAWLGRRLAQMHAKILVPVTPDMNSVLGIRAVERFFAGSQDAEGRPVRPYYVLNQFDASLPLHLDVREVLRQQLGDRLLPVMIRRSPAVAEALAEGMTVMDYAPESPIVEDYTHLAEWVRNLAAPAQSSMRAIRWSER